MKSPASGPLLSIVVPALNEGGHLQHLHDSLVREADKVTDGDYEIIYCDDGSTDNTADLVVNWHAADSRVKLIKFSRNFGKESALTAGISEARGQAILTIDADGQHPVELMPKFIAAWRAGARVVVGVRDNSSGGGWFKRLSARIFYAVFSKLIRQQLAQGTTDYRLIDRSVQEAFLDLKETDRITRGLIDWLGFRQEYITFHSPDRSDGVPGYSYHRLAKLALNSVVSMTPTPLFVPGYLGMAITLFALVLGAAVGLEQIILHDPLGWKFTGTAMLGILILFLVGVVLMSQGILSLYISHIQAQSKQRPLYVIDYQDSIGIDKKSHHAHRQST
jgi:glycosyltransferase involved in cell wall biosynthesis